MSHASFFINRPRQFTNALYPFTVYLNGKPLKKIYNGQHIAQTVPAGSYSIYCQMAGAQTEVIEWKADSASQLTLECTSIELIKWMSRGIIVTLIILFIWIIGGIFLESFFRVEAVIIVSFASLFAFFSQVFFGIWQHQKTNGSQILFLKIDKDYQGQVNSIPPNSHKKRDPTWLLVFFTIMVPSLLTGCIFFLTLLFQTF